MESDLTAGVLSLKVSVSSATLRLDERIHGFEGLGFAHMLLHHLTTAGANPSPVADQDNLPEEVTFDDDAVEPRRTALWIEPPQEDNSAHR